MTVVLEALLYFAPALALALALLMRRYPGERILIARRAGRRRNWGRPRSSAPSRLRAPAVAAHGGLLIARSLAVRPPPPALAAS